MRGARDGRAGASRGWRSVPAGAPGGLGEGGQGGLSAPGPCIPVVPQARQPAARMSYMLPHLHNGWQVDQAILSEEDRVVVIRFGHDWDPTCMKMDEVLYSIAEKVSRSFLLVLRSVFPMACLEPGTGCNRGSAQVSHTRESCVLAFTSVS